MDVLKYFNLEKYKQYAFHLSNGGYIDFYMNYHYQYEIYYIDNCGIFSTILDIGLNDYDFYVDDQWINIDEFRKSMTAKSFKVEQKMIYK